jgi:hypothetical protein
VVRPWVREGQRGRAAGRRAAVAGSLAGPGVGSLGLGEGSLGPGAGIAGVGPEEGIAAVAGVGLLGRRRSRRLRGHRDWEVLEFL